MSNNIVKEFSRHSHNYSKLNIVQKLLAKEVSKNIVNEKKILDLGCGCGEIFGNLNSYELFVAIDISSVMCLNHPKTENCFIFNLNFEDSDLVDKLKEFAPFDIVVSSSSLQWAKDLDKALFNISQLSEKFVISLFTSETFKRVQQLGNVKSPLHDKNCILKVFNKHFQNINYKLFNHQLFFNNSREIFKYIKDSGVSGGEKKLSFKATKELILNYDLNYLEFEALIIKNF